MIIKCIRNDKNDEMINIDKNYIVLGVYYSHDAICYQIIPDDTLGWGHPILVTLEEGFAIVSGRIPKNWIFRRNREIYGLLGPEKWVNHEYWDDSFWEDWDNSKPEALKCYTEELEIIKDVEKEFLQENNLIITEHGEIVSK